jgi:O-acetyl-ADP-ribose deacetylase (regulator of RNase III)
MPLTIVRQDITKMKTDAIVNAANTALRAGDGVGGAIFKAAGEAELQAACDKLAPIDPGDAVVTPGFRLPARHVIHTAGPIYKDGLHGEEKTLRASYRNSLKRAVENRCKSIAFPLISSGIYGYPKDKALRAATDEIRVFLADHELDVFLVVFDTAAFEISRKLLGEVENYLDEHCVTEPRYQRRRQEDFDRIDIMESRSESICFAPSPQYADKAEGSVDDLIARLDEPFSRTLLRLIDAKGKTDPEVYKRANLDRKLFSKIRSGKGYMPSKRTALALAVALELSLEETEDLLERAGFALSHSQKFDVIVEYFILHGKYDIFEINEVLFRYDQPQLGG